MNLKVAYFSMEIGLESAMPTYAGGLGILAADMMHSCADLGVQAACVTLKWKHGYMRQNIHSDGSQTYEDVDWNPSFFLKKLDQFAKVQVEGREIHVAIWVYEIKGKSTVPVYFLDTDVEENVAQDREITNHLYGGGQDMRIKQEVVLGIGGVRALRALGYGEVGTFHMNEGHAAFLTLELLKERNFEDSAVRPNSAFTTHTPVKAGHDVFDYDTAGRIVGDMLPMHIRDLAGQDALSMTELAMNLSHYTCGVSKIHGEVSRQMFPGHEIDYITNGIHHLSWVHPEMAKLYDEYCPKWREDPSVFGDFCREIPDTALWTAHQKAKQELIDYVNEHTIVPFDVDTLTLASARRVVPYKRPELIYENLKRLEEISGGRLQIIHAGNAHPDDVFAQDVIRRMVQRSNDLKDSVRIVYLENYNPDLARMMVSGSDMWLNTPMRLHEASGTSGMKACLNGALNVSTLDGWWSEAFQMDSESGWRIGSFQQVSIEEEHEKIDSESVYTLLQFEVIPEYYYGDHVRWIRRMKRSIGLVGYFNTHRAVREYLEKAWLE